MICAERSASKAQIKPYEKKKKEGQIGEKKKQRPQKSEPEFSVTHLVEALPDRKGFLGGRKGGPNGEKTGPEKKKGR